MNPLHCVSYYECKISSRFLSLQLKHAFTGKYIHVSTTQTSHTESSNMKVRPINICSPKEIFQKVTFWCYGSFPPTETDSDSDSDSKPNHYIVLCTTFSTGLDLDPCTDGFPNGYCTHFRDGSPSQGSESESVSVGGNEPLGIRRRTFYILYRRRILYLVMSTLRLE